MHELIIIMTYRRVAVNTTTDKKYSVSFLKNTVNTALQYYQILLEFNTKKMEVKSIHKLAPSHLSDLLN